MQHLAAGYFTFGFLGVDIFFVISGYVIYNSYFQFSDFQIKSFLQNRFSRLAPGIICVLAITYLVTPLRELVSHGDYVKVVFLFKNFGDWSWPLGPFWSLSSEEQFYLLAAVTVTLLSNQRIKKFFFRLMTSIVIFVQIFGLVLSVTHHNFNTPTIFNIVFFRPMEIVLGVLLGVAENHDWFEKNKILNILLHPSFAPMYLSAAIYLRSPTLVSLFAISLLRGKYSKSQIGHFFCNLLSMRGLVEIGVLSFSIYIWHVSVILMLPNFGSKSVHFLMEITLIYIVSFLSFNFLEMPARSLLKRLFSRF